VPILGILLLSVSGGVSFSFKASASIDLGIDSNNGLFFGVDDTKIEFKLSIKPAITGSLTLLGIPNLEISNATLGINLNATALIMLDDNIGGNGGDKRVFLSELGSQFAIAKQSGPVLANAGNFLSGCVLLKIDLQGNITLDLLMKSSIGALLAFLPPELRGPLMEYVGNAAKELQVFINNSHATVCENADKYTGGELKKLTQSVLGCKTEIKPFSVDEYLNVVEIALKKLKPTSISKDVFGLKSNWVWPVFKKNICIGGASGGGARAIGNGTNPNDPMINPNESGPNDYIKYKVTNGVMTITAREGKDDVRIEDLGAGVLRLSRFGIEPNGTEHRDPIRTFTGISRVIAHMKEGNDYFEMTSTLPIPATVNGNSGNDTLLTGSGNDEVNGGDGDDRMVSGAGNDIIDGGTGNDTVLAGDGDDNVIGQEGDDQLFGEEGHDIILGGAGNDNMTGGSGNDNQFGNSGNDTIEGGQGIDHIEGNEGDDNISDEGGNNRLLGNAGNDTITGGSGDDQIFGGEGNDFLTAGSGTGEISGEAGEDRIYGRQNRYRLLGGNGNDYIQAGNGDDVLVGGMGNDTLVVNNPDDTIITSRVELIVYGGSESDSDAGQAEDVLLILNGGNSSYSTDYASKSFPNSALVTTANDLKKQVIRYSGVQTAYDTVVAKLLTAADTDFGRTLQIIDGITAPTFSMTNLRLAGQSYSFTFKTEGVIQGKSGADSIILNNPVPATNLRKLDIHGDIGADTIDVIAVSVPTNVFGDFDNDLINVGSAQANNDGNLDRVNQLLTITGGDGEDHIYVNDFAKSGRTNFLVTAASVTDLPPAILPNPADIIPPRTLFAGIIYDGTAEFLQLDSNNDPNFVSAIPSADTTYKFNGNDPGFGDPLGRDCLVVDFTDTIGHRLTYSGLPENKGKWTFKNRQPIEFKNFECLNFLGNVQIKQVEDKLFLTGDSAHNGISLSGGPNGQLAVIGLGTTLNGSFVPMPLYFNGIKRIVVKTGDGDDFLQFNNVTLADVEYYAGNDNDQLQVGSGDFPDITTQAGVDAAIAAGSVNLTGFLHFDGGKGEDCADFIRTFGQALWDFNLGDGNDSITTYWSSSGDISAVTDDGDDVINFGYHVAHGGVTFDGAKGNDFLNVYISDFKKDAVFLGGSGSDTIAVDTNFFGANSTLDLGADDDYFLFASNLVNKQLTIAGGHGNDSGMIGRHIDGSSGGNIAKKLVFDGGSQNDKVRIGNNAFDDFFAVLGSGDDEMTIDDYIYIKNKGTLDGGTGKNRFNKVGTPNLKTVNI